MKTDAIQSLFGTMSTQQFLADYWQKKPCFIRRALAPFNNPLSPDELAGLACEEEVESRLIINKDARWTLRNGPFAAQDFAALDNHQGSLLVQAVDHWVPEVQQLLEYFRFIPNWRIDDIMASYAPTGGSVGPHFDYYDVFFLQGLGRREWKIGSPCDASTALMADSELRILDDFTTSESYVMEPGDLLYLPAGLSHWGIALEECMTYSVGFRAPSVADLLDQFTTELCSTLEEDIRYEDADLPLQSNPGEISAQALQRIQDLVQNALLNKTDFARWFGRYVTTPKYADSQFQGDDDQTAEALSTQELTSDCQGLERNPASRFAYIVQDESILLFVDAQTHHCSGRCGEFAQLLCANATIDCDALAAYLTEPTVQALLTKLENNGSIALL